MYIWCTVQDLWSIVLLKLLHLAEERLTLVITEGCLRNIYLEEFVGRRE